MGRVSPNGGYVDAEALSCLACSDAPCVTRTGWAIGGFSSSWMRCTVAGQLVSLIRYSCNEAPWLSLLYCCMVDFNLVSNQLL